MKKNAIIAVVVGISLIAACEAGAATPAATPAYTFTGRLMDARHAAFGTDRVASVSAYDASGELLVESSTFHRDDSRRNYALSIPLATAESDGYATKGAALDVRVVDDKGKAWNGVLVDPVCGVAGAVREVDIVLGEDANHDGIDDSLYEELKLRWEISDFCNDDEEFDPTRDYDGDGVSTIDEALSGTNPFDASDVLRITAFSLDGAPATRGGKKWISLSFNAVGGHAYSVQEASDLVAGDWKKRGFSASSGGETINVMSFPADGAIRPCTVYLLPSSDSKAFFRIEAE